jgi:hypothetical protein
MTLTLEDFQGYLHFKAYDVISSGQFKRHLSQCRENGDEWAIKMYRQSMAVQARVRELSTMVGQLPSRGALQAVCRDVMTCAHPPIKVLTGQNRCSISGETTQHCVDLTRAAKNSKEVFVHPRFWFFFVMLWYCSKLEYVVRACTKQWPEARGLTPEERTFTSVCETFADQNEDLAKGLFRLFEQGMQYITTSLGKHMERHTLRPVLTPSDSYMAAT